MPKSAQSCSYQSRPGQCSGFLSSRDCSKIKQNDTQHEPYKQQSKLPAASDLLKGLGGVLNIPIPTKIFIAARNQVKYRQDYNKVPKTCKSFYSNSLQRED